MLDKQRLKTFLLGGAAGAVAGVLLAPRSGREIRNTIANRAEEFRERGNESYFEARERLQDRLADARNFRRHSAADEADAGPDAGVVDSPGETSPRGVPHLRDVSAGGQRETQDARAEELRKKVQETRARIRARLEGGPSKRG